MPRTHVAGVLCWQGSVAIGFLAPLPGCPSWEGRGRVPGSQQWVGSESGLSLCFERWGLGSWV